MNYLSGAFRYVARGETEPQNNVSRLIDRIKTSALPQDRRNAIVQLTEVSKTSPQRQVEVGELSLKVLYAVLEQDIDYDETIRAALDLLIAICGRLDPPQLGDTLAQDPAQQQELLSKNRAFDDATSKAAATNVDVFLGLPNALSLLLQLLEKGDFYVKFGAIELLTAMAANSKRTLQMAVLEAAQGVARICDLLDDTHRHIRSNTVLLLSTLCEESSEICKIIAFGGVLEKLFGLIDAVVTDSGSSENVSPDEVDDEDSLEAAVVIQDVLQVVKNLITGARTTKTVFRDTGCLQRLVTVTEKAAKDAGMTSTQDDKNTPGQVTGLARTIQRQAKKNVILAMNCISNLVIDCDEQSKLVKDDLCSTKLLKTLASIAFSKESDTTGGLKASDSVLSARISAFRALACLIRGHENLRQAFASEELRDGPKSETTNIQVATMNAMLRDPSAAVRVAAYTTLRDSFVVDAGLGLPSSALLSAFVDAEGTGSFSSSEIKGASHLSHYRGHDSRLPENPAKFIAMTLKETLVGYPTTSDAAGVFYAAGMISWVLGTLQGAKERLCSAHVNGSALLPQILRALGKVERERGAAEVRISLFTLVCEWLYGSSAAVSAFLSSAMHLPMLVDIISSSGSRGDIAEVHTRGLSAVILGICLGVTDGDDDATRSGSALFGGRGSSVVIPRVAVPDVIRNRIGVTVFTSCLDDLRATNAFSTGYIHELLWKSAEEIGVIEIQNGLLCSDGSVGHEFWYSKSTVDLVAAVYKSVGEKVLDLVADSSQGIARPIADGTSTTSMNGHADIGSSQDVQKAMMADSARDEVINSYKEFIRKQDENFKAAQSQIAELTAALQQAQLELDKTGGASLSNDIEASEKRGVLLAEKEALEGLLEEKTADFEALSNAFAALEAEHNASSQNTVTKQSEEMAADVQRLKMQNNSLKSALDSETHKNEELARHSRLLDDSTKSKDAELSALASERDALKTNAHPEVVEALQWRTRAEVAESRISSRQELIDSYQNSNATLQDQLREAERARDEVLATVTSLTKRFNSTRSELESLHATRRLELQVSRETSAASDASAMSEIASLKEQLEQARQDLQKEIAAKAKGPTATEMSRFEQMQSEYQAVVNAYEKMKTELMDSKQAVAQWQKRAETSEAARQREGAEKSRVMDHARALEGQLKDLNDTLLSQRQSSEASTTRVSELEQQCKEIDEIRKHTEEELITIKEQLAARTEQSIRLSGQLYELEESKEKLEDEIEALRVAGSSPPEARDKAVEQLQIHDTTNVKGIDPKVERLQAELSELQKELDATRNALADSKDRESLSEAQARDRNVLITKIDSLEGSLSTIRAEKVKLEGDVDIMKERLLSLDEAEESKRALTMQVVSLQESLAELEKRGTSPSRGGATDQAEKVERLTAEMAKLRIRSNEKDMRLGELESSLGLALDRAKTAERDKQDMENQVSAAETMFSVLRSEKDGLMKENEELQTQVEVLSPLAEDSAHLEDLQKKLTDAEKMRDAVSQELASLVAACKISERESKQLKDDSVRLKQSLTTAKRELSELQIEYKEISLSRNVDDVINSMLVSASLITQESVTRQVIENLQIERDEVVAALETSRKELQDAVSEMAKLPSLVKERNEAIARNEEQSNRVDALSQELVGLQVIANERDKLASALVDANASIDELTEQKTAAVTALGEANSLIKSMKEATAETKRKDAIPVEDIAIQHRVQELEEALRDAAKTVTATNSELIAAQSLLVDLSADKTAMRTDLSAAQEQINELVRQVANLSRATQAVPALSEVSEQEHSIGEDTSVSPTPVVREEEVTEGIIQSVKAEAGNLRTALQRSMSEADSVADLVKSIETRIAEVEAKLKESRDMATTSRDSTDALSTELRRLRECRRAEKDSYERDVDSYKARIHDLKGEIEQTKEIWKETLSISEESWSVERGKLENELTGLRNHLNKSTEERSDLQNKLDEVFGELEAAKASVEKLEASKQRLSSSLKTLEEEQSHLKQHIEMSNAKEESLEDALRQMKSDLQSTKESYEANRKRLEDQHRIEVKDLEDELDRASSAIESAERTFRDSEVSLKEQITQQKASLRELEQKQKRTQESLRWAQAEVQRISCQKDQLETNLTDTVQHRDLEISALKVEINDVKKSLAQSREDCVNLRKTLQDTEATLKKTVRDLQEETEQKSMLETENQDFLSTIESLEGLSKRARDELSQRTNDLDRTEETLRALQSNLKDKTERMQDMERNIADKCGEIQLLKQANTNLENQKNELDDNLKNTEQSRDSLAQDNKDLLAWVSDLEKRATELQSAASDFQEVEQNLRDALESQRYASEQNAKLVEELRKEKTTLSAVQVKILQVQREREVAHAERDSSRRRAQELEARIREIRENNLAKFSQSEEAIRAKAKQCAELETALAAAERKVAELESVSDDLFGATTSLKQLSEEMSTLRDRALSAEETAETLRKDLQAAEAEVSAARERSSGDALRSLEAEHNELLVYLADLELEVTNLREDLGRE